jgi:hypothetical protein
LVPITTARCILRLQMEEQPPIWRVTANILNKKPRTADKGWPSNLGVGRGSNNPHHKNVSCYEIFRQSLGPGVILWCNLCNESGT